MNINGHHLAQDLADVLDLNALDKALTVLVEWDIIDATVASDFFTDMQEAN
jgi:hypothetical protein